MYIYIYVYIYFLIFTVYTIAMIARASDEFMPFPLVSLQNHPHEGHKPLLVDD